MDIRKVTADDAAVLCIPNETSVRLHEKYGFRQISHFKEVGYKFNEWQDIGDWQLTFI